MPFKPLHCIYGNVRIPQRWVLAIVLHLAMQNAYNLRVVINLAVNEMVKRKPKSNSTKFNDCPNLIPDKDPPQKDGQYSWNSDEQALIKYIFFVGYFFGHLPGGWLADKIGARHVTGTCLLLAALVNLILPMAIIKGGEKWGFYLCIFIRALIGLFQGSIVPTIATFMSSWAPKKERAMLGGVAYGGGNLGNIMGIILTGLVIFYTQSWSMAFYLWGCLTIGWYVLFLFTGFSYPDTHPFISEEERDFLIANTAKKGVKFKVPWSKISRCCPIWAILAAQFGHNYVLFMMNTDLPKFVKDYLKMNIKNNGFVSALPFIFCWISAILSGFVADCITNRNLMSILNMRKLLTIISIIVPAFCNLGSVYVGCSRFWVIFLCTFGMFWMGPFWPALKVNVNDLSRHYGGVLMAIINGIGAWAGVLAPFITGYFTKDVIHSQRANLKPLDVWSITTKDESICTATCGRIPQRYVLAIMLHLALQNAYCMRIVLNMAIVEMVEPDAKRNASEQACPEYDTMSADREDHKFDWPHSAKTRILYSFFIGYTLTCFPGGWLADRYGGRYVLGGTVLFSSIINVAFPYLTKKGGHMMAVVLRGLLGIVQGPILPAIASFMSTWSPPDERRVLGGISYGGSNLGTILGSLFTGIVIEKFKGWPAAFYFWSSISLGYILLHMIYVFSWPFTHPYMSEEELDYLNKSIVPKRVFKTPWKAILRNVPFWANVCGQFGHNYIFFIMVTWLPTYMKEVLRFDIAENGLLSALPFIALWVSSLILSFTGNYILSTLHWMPTLTFNKLFGSFSNIVCSVLVLAAVYVGCNRTLCITLYIIGMILKAFYYITFPVNINELSKHFGGIMFGICNTIGSGSGLMGTVIVGSLTKHNKLSEWKIAFWITFIIEVVSSTIFCLWASSDRQAFDYEVEEPEPE